MNQIPFSPIVQGLTAVPAFIGYTQKALDVAGDDITNKPTKISSVIEYEKYFGTAQPETGIEINYTQETNAAGSKNTISFSFAAARQSRHNLATAIRLFYANGGQSCYVVSVGAYKPVTGDRLVESDFETGLNAIREVDEITLILIPEGQNMIESEYYSLLSKALQQCGDLRNRFCIMDVYGTGKELNTTSDLHTAVQNFRTGFSSLNNSYGAAYFPNVKTVYPYPYDEAFTVVNHLLNGSKGPLDRKTLADISSANPAAYTLLKQALDTSFPVILPPSPAVAGIYAKVDESRGIWKAPANVALNGVSATTFPITEALQEGLNIDAASGKSINAIRAFTGRGILVWGARTLDGNSNDFRYVSVRRFFIMVEESVQKGVQRFVFEPNDATTWTSIRAMIENYLFILWKQGAFPGTKPGEAFYVKVGLGQTMTTDDIQSGRLIAEIGMALLRPAEFTIFSISQLQQQA